MSVQVEKENGAVKFIIENNMTIFNASELKQTLLDALSEPTNIKLDLSQVNEIDSAGFQLLLMLKNESKKNNKEYQITACSSAVTSLLDLFNLKDNLLGDSA